MSLDVYLRMKGAHVAKHSSGIFVRQNGSTQEISRDEWNKKYSGEPVTFKNDETESDEVYSANITHNLGTMADHAGIYEALWRPHRLKPDYNIPEGDHQAECKFEDGNIIIAKDLIEPLRQGLHLLKSEPERFKQFNPDNGWGNYEGLVNFVEKYLNACYEYPSAEVEVSR